MEMSRIKINIQKMQYHTRSIKQLKGFSISSDRKLKLSQGFRRHLLVRKNNKYSAANKRKQ